MQIAFSGHDQEIRTRADKKKFHLFVYLVSTRTCLTTELLGPTAATTPTMFRVLEDTLNKYYPITQTYKQSALTPTMDFVPCMHRQFPLGRRAHSTVIPALHPHKPGFHQHESNTSLAWFYNFMDGETVEKRPPYIYES